MLKLAILKAKDIYDDNGNYVHTTYRPVFEGEDGDLEREIASRVRKLLGPKESHTGSEIDSAIARAFKDYKEDFKRQTIKLK